LLGRIENFINGLEELLVSIQVQCSRILLVSYIFALFDSTL
jgi:hypothetical protein